MIAETLLMGSHALIRSHQFGLSLQISQETCLLKSQETYLLEIANSSISSASPLTNWHPPIDMKNICSSNLY